MAPNKSQDITRVEKRLDAMAQSKISRDFAIAEIDNLKYSVKRLNTELESVEDKVSKPHDCTQSGAFQAYNERLNDANKLGTINTSAIRRLYVWQAGVGISLLIFFLTVGIAALKYVSDIDHSVQANSKSIQRIELKLEKEDKHEKEDLKQFIREAVIEAQSL